jgi:anti-sigma factor RsiW
VTSPCGRARRLLWPDENLRVADQASFDARAHVGHCDACQRFLADMSAMGTLVQRLVSRPVTPPSVRDRLFSAIARERSMAGQRQMRFSYRARTIVAGAIAVAALTLLVLLPVYRDRGASDATWRNAISAIVADHARGLNHEALMTADALVARQWLSARVAFAVHVPEVSGTVLERVEICLLDGQRTCLIRYRAGKHALSYYSFSLSPGDVPNESAANESGSAAFHQEEEAGYRVVAWEDAGVLRALVSDLPEDQLLALARACRAHRNRA